MTHDPRTAAELAEEQRAKERAEAASSGRKRKAVGRLKLRARDETARRKSRRHQQSISRRKNRR